MLALPSEEEEAEVDRETAAEEVGAEEEATEGVATEEVVAEGVATEEVDNEEVITELEMATGLPEALAATELLIATAEEDEDDGTAALEGEEASCEEVYVVERTPELVVELSAALEVVDEEGSTILLVSGATGESLTELEILVLLLLVCDDCAKDRAGGVIIDVLLLVEPPTIVGSEPLSEVAMLELEELEMVEELGWVEVVDMADPLLAELTPVAGVEVLAELAIAVDEVEVVKEDESDGEAETSDATGRPGGVIMRVELLLLELVGVELELMLEMELITVLEVGLMPALDTELMKVFDAELMTVLEDETGASETAPPTPLGEAFAREAPADDVVWAVL